MFNCRKNIGGVVRDHIYSRMSGFKNKVFPEILRHPCNCQILLHSDNIKKQDGITLNELFNKIKKYKGTWKEHKLCLTLIKRFENGETWKRKE